MAERWSDGAARLIRATGAVDRAYRAFDHLRSKLVVTFATDATLDRYNDLAYGATHTYRPDTVAFRQVLFAWEKEAVDRFFPPPPARILVGGAGGGREAFALANRGYEVVAFEPSRALVEAMACSVPAGARVTVHRAGYEDLPCLFPATSEGPAVHLNDLSPFDAGIVGWASFSHLRSDEQRMRTLSAFARVTNGPVLVSFFAASDTHSDARTWRARLRYKLLNRVHRHPGDVFGMGIGFYHHSTPDEISALAEKSGLTLAHMWPTDDGVNWPHAVMVPRSPTPSKSGPPSG